MSYNTVNAMAQSQSLLARVAACAAELGNTQPQQWAGNNMLILVATAGASLQTTWDNASGDAYARAGADTGKREDVVTDAMIQTAVTNLKTSQAGTQGWPA